MIQTLQKAGLREHVYMARHCSMVRCKRVTLINLPQFVLARKASEVLGWMPQCSDLAAIITDARRWHNKRFGSKGL